MIDNLSSVIKLNHIDEDLNLSSEQKDIETKDVEDGWHDSKTFTSLYSLFTVPEKTKHLWCAVQMNLAIIKGQVNREYLFCECGFSCNAVLKVFAKSKNTTRECYKSLIRNQQTWTAVFPCVKYQSGFAGIQRTRRETLCGWANSIKANVSFPRGN